MNDLIERLRLGDGTRPDHELLLEAADALEALAQPEQEPVAWWNDTGTHIDLNVSGRGTPLYTTPPQRKPLTKDEICAIGGIVAHGDVFFINIKQLNQLVGIKE